MTASVGSSFIKSSLLRLYLHLQRLGRKVRYFVRFRGQSINIDPSASVSRNAVIRVTGGGSITIGKECEIHDYSMILTYGGDIFVGDHCSLNPFAIIYGHGGVRIGNGVRVAAHTVIIPANHKVPVEGQRLHRSGFTAKGIQISDDVWLGTGSRILDGVNIGRNAVVGAGGVVVESVPEFTTVAGVPARVIAKR